MAYVGQEIPIPLGQILLRTDDAQSQLPPNAAIKANNIDVYTGNIAKSSASTKYNTVAIDAIVALWDWFPTPSLQRLIAVSSTGKVFRDTGDTTFNTQTAIKTGLGSPTSDTIICEGGAEAAGVNKKLFLFLGSAQVQVISGDATTTAAILFPAIDWASNFPTAGIVHNGRLWAFGNSNNRHTVYASRATNTEATQTFTVTIASPAVLTTPTAHGLAVGTRLWFTTTGALPTGLSILTAYYVTAAPSTTTIRVSATAGGSDVNTSGSQSGTHTLHYGNMGHEDFHTAASGDTALTFPVYPGEGDGLIAAFEYQSRLFFFKRPFGVYYLDDASDPATSSTWAIKKLTDAWGIASPHGALKILQDLLGANSTGSYTSLQATNAFGDVAAGDILALNQLENYIREQFSKAGISSTQAIYYAEKKKAYFTARSAGGSAQDRMLVIDVSKQTPRFSIETKDSPACLALRKDANSIPRPIYGTTTGFVNQMDQSGYSVNGVPYLAEIQTAYTDFSWVDASLSGKNKLFDFLDVSYVPRGSWPFYIDVYVDGLFRETVTIRQTQSRAVLGTFVLDVDLLSDPPTVKQLRVPLHCTGRAISLRIYNGSLDQDFRVDKLLVCFRLSAEQQT